jgi:SAM-dependent methyltransferase
MTALSPGARDDGALRTRMEALFKRAFSDDLERAYSYIDRLCLQMCFHLVHECGLLEPEIEPFDRLVERVGVSPDAAHLVAAVLDILREEGFAKRTDEGWRGERGCPPDRSSELQLRARAACAGATPTLDLLERCHEHALDFLRGRSAGVETIFPRGNIALWERLHNVDTVMSIYADLIVPALDAVLAPRMRVLEVGAGVGAVLGRSLALLRRRDIEEYWFTDLGQTFLLNARSEYGEIPWLRFARIDIDVPLWNQGLQPESFDVVIGVNVLHVAKELRRSLHEIRRTLKADGYLILAEGSPPSPSERWRLDIVFAFLRGWWDVSLDPVVRPRPGFLLPDEWEVALRACGYDPVSLLPGEAWFRGPCRGGVVIARKQLTTPGCDPPGPGNGALVWPI